DRPGLGQHAILKAAALAKALEARDIGVGNEGARIFQSLENAWRASAENELLSTESGPDGCRHRIRIDVEQRALIVCGQGAHHRYQAVVEQAIQNGGVDAIDIADEPEVHGFTVHLHWRAAMRQNEPGIHATHADRVDLEFTTHREHARVDE